MSAKSKSRMISGAASIAILYIVPAYAAEQSSFTRTGNTRAGAIAQAKNAARSFIIWPRVLDRIELDGCSEVGGETAKWECTVTVYYHQKSE